MYLYVSFSRKEKSLFCKSDHACEIFSWFSAAMSVGHQYDVSILSFLNLRKTQERFIAQTWRLEKLFNNYFKNLNSSAFRIERFWIYFLMAWQWKPAISWPPTTYLKMRKTEWCLVERKAFFYDSCVPLQQEKVQVPRGHLFVVRWLPYVQEFSSASFQHVSYRCRLTKADLCKDSEVKRFYLDRNKT